MAFTLDVTAIKNYINENRDVLISKIVSMTDSTKWMNVQNGITTDTNIHGLITDLTIQDGSNCGFTPEGSQTITARTLEPNFLKVNTQYCPKDFYGTYKHYETKVAMGKSQLPLEEELVNDILKAIANKNEKLLWEGDKSTGDLVDGFTTIIANDSAIPTANKFTSSETTVLARLQEMYKKVGDKRVSAVMSSAMYRELITNIVNTNYFVYHEDENNDMVLTLPATNFKVYGIDGIDDADTNIYGVIWDEMFVGMDNADDASQFDFFWSADDRVYKLDVEWVLTPNYMYSDNIYVYGI